MVRITVTLPPDVLEKVDRQARKARRSRSWVIAEAARQSLSGDVGGRHAEPDTAIPIRFDTGLGEQRLAQLRADLRLSPEQRVREAERTAKMALHHGERERVARTGISRLVGFKRYEDFLEYQRRERLR